MIYKFAILSTALFCLFMIITHLKNKPSVISATNNPDKAKALIKEHLKMAKKNVRIISGNGFAKVYSDPDVMEIFRTAHSKKVKTTVLVEEDVLDNGEGANGLQTLADEGKIELIMGVKSFLYNRNHFRLIDNSLLYLELEDHLKASVDRPEEKPYLLFKKVQSRISKYLNRFEDIHSRSKVL